MTEIQSQNINSYTFVFDDVTRKYAEEILNETDDSRTKAIEEIRFWLKEEKANLCARDDDRSILAFLRGCKFRIDPTKEKITNYYTMRRDRIEWFENRNPMLPVVQELVRLGVFVPLKKFQDNKLVVIVRTAIHNPKVHKLDDVLKASKMILDIASLENEIVSIYGVTAIFDMNGISFGHYKQLMSPGAIKKMTFAIQNYHVRPKQLEFINAPIYINVVLSVIKNFLSEKLRQRINVYYKGHTGIENIVDKEILPTEYGGHGESIESLSNYWCDKLISYKDWFEEDQKYKAE